MIQTILQKVFKRVKQVGKRQPFLNLPDWEALIKTNTSLWREKKRKATKGPKILIGTTTGGIMPLSMPESVLAVALTLRGANVSTLLCDRFLPACLNIQKLDIPEETLEKYQLDEVKCKGCYQAGDYLYQPLQLTNYTLSQLVTHEEKTKATQLAQQIPLSEVPDYCLGGYAIGEHAYAGALRYYASGNLDNEAKSEVIVRRYLESALLTTYATVNLLKKESLTAACFNHGIYTPHGIIGEVCRSNQVRVVNWNIAYRKHCYIFSHGDTYHHTMLTEPIEIWEDMPWNQQMHSDILSYLKSRWYGTQDWIWFHEKPDEEFEQFAQKIGIDRNKPIIGMLTNVMWDAQLHYRANAFPNMLSWVVETIKYFEAHPHLQLLIRIHPAEIRGTLPSRQPLLAEIEKLWPQLPSNIFIIAPESPVSTYAAMRECDSVIIYGTKTGVELTSIGIPVIVAGEAWIRNKGITIDASTPQEYFECLDKLPLGSRLDAQITERACKYAYHFFFRRMIPLEFIEPAPGKPPYKLNMTNLEELLPGVHPGLDVICDGILSGSPFVSS